MRFLRWFSLKMRRKKRVFLCGSYYKKDPPGLSIAPGWPRETARRRRRAFRNICAAGRRLSQKSGKMVENSVKRRFSGSIKIIGRLFYPKSRRNPRAARGGMIFRTYGLAGIA